MIFPRTNQCVEEIFCWWERLICGVNVCGGRLTAIHGYALKRPKFNASARVNLKQLKQKLYRLFKAKA